MKLQRFADGLTVVVGLVALGVIGARVFDSPASVAPAGPSEVQLDASAIGIDFSAADRTFVMVIQSDCPYCEESLAFYEGLPRSAAVQVVIAAPAGDAEIEKYRAAIEPDSVVFVEPGVMPVSSTPTLLLADRRGIVESAWVGLLDASREEQVMSAVFGVS